MKSRQRVFGGHYTKRWAFHVALVVKNPPANAGDIRHMGLIWVGKIPWRREWQLTSEFLLGNPMDRGVWCICRMEYHSAIEKNEIMPFAETRRDLGLINFSAVNHRTTFIILYHL